MYDEYLAVDKLYRALLKSQSPKNPKVIAMLKACEQFDPLLYKKYKGKQ